MQEQEAVRRLVKSPPELWAQCSDPQRLAQHLSGFGEIKITRLEPESTVAWEGESLRGTVSLEVSGWGTRVRLTAGAADDAREAPTTELEAEEIAGAGAAPTRLLLSEPRGLGALIGLIRRRRRSEEISPTLGLPAESEASPPAPEIPASPEAGQLSESPDHDVVASLEAALDSLGSAHHRPYSRS